MISKLKLLLLMPFVYPVIFFTSLHVIRSSYGLKYALFQIWSRWLLKRSKSKVNIINPELIPLENDYVFVSSHGSNFDPLILASVLPVETHFILKDKERLPFVNVYSKRLKIQKIFPDRHDLDIEVIEQNLSQSSVCVFLDNFDDHLGLQTFFKAATEKHWTLIPVLIKNNEGILKNKGYHSAVVEIKTPVYFEEYEGKSSAELASLINDRIHLL